MSHEMTTNNGYRCKTCVQTTIANMKKKSSVKNYTLFDI